MKNNLYWKIGNAEMIKRKNLKNLFIKDQFHYFALMIIMALALWVRIHFLSAPIRYDEAWTFNFYASKPLSYGLSKYLDPNNHLLNTFLIHLSCSLFGNKPWIIRLPAFIFGILLVPASYLVGRFFYNRNAALFATGLVASSSVLVQYSTDARGYTMVSFGFMALLLISGHIARRIKPAPLWAAFIATSVLGFYAMPTMLYPFLLIVIWLLFTIDKKKQLTSLIVAVLLTGALTFFLYLPVLVTSGIASLTSNDWVKALPLNRFFPAFYKNLPVVWEEWNRDTPFVLQLLFFTGFLTTVLTGRNTGNLRIRYVFTGMLGFLLLVFLQRVVPFARVWLFLLPLYFSVAAAGIAWVVSFFESRVDVRKWPFFPVLTIALTLFLCMRIYSTGSPGLSNDTVDDFVEAEPVARFLTKHIRPWDEIISSLMPVAAPLSYYLNYYGIREPVKACWTSNSSKRCSFPAIGLRLFIVIKEGNRIKNELPQQERFDGVFNEKQNDLEDILARHSVSGSSFSSPRLIYENGSTRVYELVRHKSNFSNGPAANSGLFGNNFRTF